MLSKNWSLEKCYYPSKKDLVHKRRPTRDKTDIIIHGKALLCYFNVVNRKLRFFFFLKDHRRFSHFYEKNCFVKIGDRHLVLYGHKTKMNALLPDPTRLSTVITFFIPLRGSIPTSTSSKANRRGFPSAESLTRLALGRRRLMLTSDSFALLSITSQVLDGKL